MSILRIIKVKLKEEKGLKNSLKNPGFFVYVDYLIISIKLLKGR